MEPQPSLATRMRALHVDLVALVASFAWDLDAAAASGLLDVVKLLLRSSHVACSFRALNAAARHGHLEVVRVLHGSALVSCSAFAMNMAAANGHLDVVQFLHEHRSEGCTSYAMDAAAARGHFEVVQFLHFNRREGCTTAAMDLAAAQGHLEVVEFLHRHRTEGATVAAIDRAAQNGHLRVVQFCREMRHEDSMKFLFAAAAVAAAASSVVADEFCGQWDTATAGDYIVYNNLWGASDDPSGSQCTGLDSHDGATIAWHTRFDWAGTSWQVKSYANAALKFDALPLENIASIPTTMEYTYSYD
ncbi:hypothetical protein BBJ28_00024638, partial [Nothophytophthora sp. Chile5]